MPLFGLDDVLKLITAIISVITVGRLIYELGVSRKARLRDDYTFAKQFFEELGKTPRPHPLVIERGYHAIAGDASLSVREVEYLLSLESPSTALRSYVLAREYLEDLPEAGSLRVKFKAKYAADWARRWRRGYYLSVYFVCAILAVSPMFLLGAFASNLGVGLLTVLVFGGAFSIPAFNALKKYAGIHHGEKLVAGQKQHTQLISAWSETIKHSSDQAIIICPQDRSCRAGHFDRAGARLPTC